MKTWVARQRGVGAGMEEAPEAWSGESGTWHAGWRSPRLKGRHRGLTARTTQQPYLLRLQPTFSCQGSLTPVPPEGYRRRPLARPTAGCVLRDLHICPSIGCRCQFRPNRCMAVVSNEKSHLFLLEAEMGLPSHRGQVGGNMGTQFSSTQRPWRALEGTGPTGMTQAWTLPSRAHSLGRREKGQDGGTFRRSRPFASKVKNNNLQGKTAACITKA